MSLQKNIAKAVNGHNVMAVALSKIANGHTDNDREVAKKALTECGLEPHHVLAVHGEFETIYGQLKKRRRARLTSQQS